MDNVKFLICGDVKKPQRKFGDAGCDMFVPELTDRFVEDIVACNKDVLVIGSKASNARKLPESIKILVSDGSIAVEPGCDIKFPIYVKSKISPDTVLIVTNKSGVCTKQKLAVGAATIDSSYQGIHHVHLYNFSNETQLIMYGQKIVQEVPIKINPDDIVVEEGISEEEFYDGVKSERGAGGFGSSGIF